MKLLEPVMILLIKSINESILGILNPMAPVNTNIIPALNKNGRRRVAITFAIRK